MHKTLHRKLKTEHKQTPIKPRGVLMCSGRGSGSYSKTDRLILFAYVSLFLSWYMDICMSLNVWSTILCHLVLSMNLDYLFFTANWYIFGVLFLTNFTIFTFCRLINVTLILTMYCRKRFLIFSSHIALFAGWQAIFLNNGLYCICTLSHVEHILCWFDLRVLDSWSIRIIFRTGDFIFGIDVYETKYIVH